MSTPIRIDPETGLKLFDTRAAIATERIRGKGYSVVTDERLKQLPEQPKGAKFDVTEQEKYRQYKEARRGAADYMAMEGEFSRYLKDLYSAEPIQRESLHDECEILVVGAGFAGLLLWHKLRQAGFKDVRFCEKGGDVGGTWYWNRYPGVACDVEAYSYLPLLEEMGYFPTMKFVSGFEILEYCQSMATKFGFYDHCLFHTTVENTEWDETTGMWTVRTDRGDVMRARYVILANGILTTPKLARIDGMETFKGESFHTSRWNYNVDLEGKRIGIIGTGATAVQVIPELAKIAGHLYVFQRTPSTIDVRDQRETTQEEIEAWKDEPGWARARRARFARISSGRTAIQANDDYLAGKVQDFKERKEHETKLTPEEMVQKQLETNFRIMEQIRARVEAIVTDPKTAESLKPYYPYGCKRPTFHDRCPKDQRARHRARRQAVRPGRHRLRNRLPVDGDVNVQLHHRSRRADAEPEVEGRRYPYLPRPAHQWVPQPLHRHGTTGRRRQLQLHGCHRVARGVHRLAAHHHARARRWHRGCHGGLGAVLRTALPRRRCRNGPAA